MPFQRTKIELALDDLIHSQCGINFQRLATYLAKQKYPALEPTEWFDDGGEDAITVPSLSNDGINRSLATSLSGTWTKVKEDCNRIRSRGVTINTLVFYTPVRVTNIEMAKWRKKVGEEYHHDLEVVGQARIVADLENPKNAWLCKNYLNLPFEDEPDLEALKQKIREVAQTTLDQWKSNLGFDAPKQIYLTLTMKSRDEKNAGRTLSIEECCETIRLARKVILKGVPGAGKTITLLQIAEKLLGNEQASVPILVSLSHWAETHQDLFAFLAERPTYRTAGISINDLSRLNSEGQLILLLNGWNEISPETTRSVFLSLEGILTESPATAFVIATRDTTVSPPLMDPVMVQVEPLESRQRRTIIELSGVSDPPTLIHTIENEPALEEITRTPLFLVGVIELARQNKILPDSRYGIIRSLVESTESNPLHQVRLRTGPCKGCHRTYLIKIGAGMCGKGGTSLKGALALESIGATSQGLALTGLIGPIPDARSVLDSLTSDHLLVGSETTEDPSIRFVHQQFQEWFAAEALYEDLIGLSNNLLGDAASNFRLQIVNKPLWEEPLKFLAERLNSKNGFENASDQADTLVRLVIPVDLFFAAQLSNIAGWRTLGKAREELNVALRSMYGRHGEAFKEYALAGMLATGSEDFSDIFEPLYKNDDQQVRLGFYRTLQPFPVSCLGGDWRDCISKWGEARRIEFVHELIWDLDATLYGVAVDFARNDPSPKVRIGALKTLSWNGNSGTVIDIVKNESFGEWPDELFTEVFDLIPIQSLSEILPWVKSSLNTVSMPSARLFILKCLADIGDTDSESLLKTELESEASDLVLMRLLPLVHRKDADWVGAWLTKKMLQGECWDEQFAIYLDRATSEALGAIAKEASSPQIGLNTLYKRLRVMRKINDDAVIRVLVSRYLDEYTEFLREPREEDRHGERAHALSHAVGEWPSEVLVRVCRSIDELPMDSYRVEAILYLLHPHTAFEEELRRQVSEEDLLWLRDLIAKWDQSVPPLNNDQGGRRADLAILLGAIGKPEDTSVLEKWIQEDLERQKNTKSAMNYSNWYAGALTRLQCSPAADVLLKLLDNSKYFGYASVGLWNMVRADNPSPEVRHFFGPNYKGVHEARKTPQFGPSLPIHPRREEFAQAIAHALTERLDELDSAQNHNFSPWGFQEATIALAHLGEEGYISLLLRSGNIEALTVLVTNGILLPGHETYAVVNPVITRQENDYQSYHGNYWYLAERCFALLLFSAEPALGVERIRRLPDKIRVSYKMRELIRLLGLCRANEAGEYLAELADQYDVIKFCVHEYINALVASETQAARSALLRIIDDFNTGKIAGLNRGAEIKLQLGQAIGQLAKNHEDLREGIRQRCYRDTQSDEQAILLDALGAINTQEAALAGCLLARDRGNTEGWSRCPTVIEEALIEKVPLGPTGGSYYRRPRAFKELRSKLMDQALNDPVRKKTSLVLLIWIENQRIELGRPLNETRHPDIDFMHQMTVPWPLVN